MKSKKNKQICCVLLVLNLILMFIAKRKGGVRIHDFFWAIHMQFNNLFEYKESHITICFWIFVLLNVIALIACIVEKKKIVRVISCINIGVIIFNYFTCMTKMSNFFKYINRFVNVYTIFIFAFCIAVFVLQKEPRLVKENDSENDPSEEKVKFKDIKKGIWMYAQDHPANFIIACILVLIALFVWGVCIMAFGLMGIIYGFAIVSLGWLFIAWVFSH